jgi:hypothetical protein
MFVVCTHAWLYAGADPLLDLRDAPCDVPKLSHHGGVRRGGMTLETLLLLLDLLKFRS